MFFEDLSGYSYGINVEVGRAMNVGWLSKTQPFAIGELDKEIQDKIEEICLNRSVIQHRGYHFCEFCDCIVVSPKGFVYSEPIRVNGVALGSRQIVIPSVQGECVYMCPDLLIHYITFHKYRPPQEFLDAVGVLDLKSYAPDFLVQQWLTGNRKLLANPNL